MLNASSLASPIRFSLIVLAWAATAAAREAAVDRLTVLDRATTQDQGTWQVDYRLRFDSTIPRVITANEVTARLEGWVSNSRAAGHSIPRQSNLVISGA
jgi:hypothetical protein